MPEFAVSASTDGVTAIDDDGVTADLSRLLVATKLAASRGEARRLLQQNAVEVDGERTLAESARLPFGAVLRAGRRRFVRVVKG